MDDLFKIIRLLGARVQYLDAAAVVQVAIGAHRQRALYQAQSRALTEFRDELAAAAIPERQFGETKDVRLALLSEVDCHKSVNFVGEGAEQSVLERFDREHKALIDQGGYIRVRICSIVIPPLRLSMYQVDSGILDVRHALVTLKGDLLNASIHNSEAELDAAIQDFENRNEDLIEDQDASWNSHMILIPPRSTLRGDQILTDSTDASTQSARLKSNNGPDQGDSSKTQTIKSGVATCFKLKRYDRQNAKMSLYAAVARQVTATLSPQLVTSIGPLSIAPRLHHDNELAAAQFRSEPVGDCGGGEIRFHHLHGSGGSDYKEALVEMLLEGARFFDEYRDVHASNIAKAREIVTAAVRRDPTLRPPVTVSAIGGLVGRFPKLGFDVVAELEILGPGLTTIVDRVVASSIEEFELKLSEVIAVHARRANLKAQLHANRQRGWIAATTQIIMEAVGLSVDFAIEHLARRNELVFDFDDDRYHAAMSWDEGVLSTNFGTISSGLRLTNRTLHIKDGYPETLIIGAIGHRLGCLVDHRYLPSEAIIVHAETAPTGPTSIDLAIPTKPIPATSLW